LIESKNHQSVTSWSITIQSPYVLYEGREFTC
jgi:hypothetical protein